MDEAALRRQPLVVAGDVTRDLTRDMTRARDVTRDGANLAQGRDRETERLELAREARLLHRQPVLVLRRRRQPLLQRRRLPLLPSRGALAGGELRREAVALPHHVRQCRQALPVPALATVASGS